MDFIHGSFAISEAIVTAGSISSDDTCYHWSSKVASNC